MSKLNFPAVQSQKEWIAEQARVCTGSYLLIILQEIRLDNQKCTSGLKMYKSGQRTIFGRV